MGGNATKQWNTERFSKQEYQDELKQLILTEFELLRVNYSSGVY